MTMPLSWHGMATVFAPENSTEPGDHRKWVSQRKNTVGKWAEELLGWADCSSITQASKQITAVTDYNPNSINRIKTPKSKLTINLKKKSGEKGKFSLTGNTNKYSWPFYNHSSQESSMDAAIINGFLLRIKVFTSPQRVFSQIIH